MSPEYTVAICQELGCLVNMEKSELDPKQVFDLKEGKTQPRTLADLYYKDTGSAFRNQPVCLASNVCNKVTDSHRKASSLRPAPHETHRVVLEKQLEGTGIPRKGDPHTKVTPP